MSLLPDDPIERGGWGPFSLPVDHPFQPAFQMHDRLFKSHEDGFGDRTLCEADSALFKSMMRIAKEYPDKSRRASLKKQAYVLYGLARMWSWAFW